MNILIVSTITAQQPGAPSHLEPGLSNDTVHFRVMQAPPPSAAVLSHLLGEECSDWILSSYDACTGVGAFISIDIDGPEEGSVIEISSTKQIHETCFILHRHQAEPASCRTLWEKSVARSFNSITRRQIAKHSRHSIFCPRGAGTVPKCSMPGSMASVPHSES